MNEDLFPHGRCECDGGQCCHGQGPAAYRVTRKGRRMIVCTRCDLGSDTDKGLLVTKEDNVRVYEDFDPLGALCLIYLFAEQEESKHDDHV